MHELPIIAQVLDLALAAAPEGAEIARVNLRVGAFCDAEPLWLERYFRTAARGTPAENALLAVRREERPPGGVPGDPGKAFGYVLESIEVRDDPGKGAP